MFERALTPQDIHDRYRVLNGAIYGLASHGRLLGAFKPANRSPDVDGPVPRRRRGPPGPGHADGADVRLDRRRHARPDVGGAGASRRPGGGSRRPAGASAADASRSRCRPRVSPRSFALFRRYCARYVAQHFHAVRLSRGTAARAAAATGPLVVSQPPVVVGPADRACVLARRCFPDRRRLRADRRRGARQVPVLRRLGFFGVEPDTPRGAAAFLRPPRRSSADPTRALWVTARAASPTRASGRVQLRPASATWPPAAAGPSSCRWRSSTRSGTSGPPRRWPLRRAADREPDGRHRRATGRAARGRR